MISSPETILLFVEERITISCAVYSAVLIYTSIQAIVKEMAIRYHFQESADGQRLLNRVFDGLFDATLNVWKQGDG